MITFEQACRLAERAWSESPIAGCFPTIEPFEASVSESREDAESYMIESAKPAVDAEGMPAMGVPVVFVSKRTGEVTLEHMGIVGKRVLEMKPVDSA